MQESVHKVNVGTRIQPPADRDDVMTVNQLINLYAYSDIVVSSYSSALLPAPIHREHDYQQAERIML